MNWEDVFNTNHGSHDDISNAAKTAREVGYRFMNWNGDIYFITPEGEPYYTGIKTESLT